MFSHSTTIRFENRITIYHKYLFIKSHSSINLGITSYSFPNPRWWSWFFFLNYDDCETWFYIVPNKFFKTEKSFMWIYLKSKDNRYTKSNLNHNTKSTSGNLNSRHSNVLKLYWISQLKQYLKTTEICHKINDRLLLAALLESRAPC